MPGITALVSTIALSKLRQPSQSWTYLGLPWMMETTGPSHSAATPEADGVVVLAQPAANPPTPAFVDVKDQQDDGNPADGSAP